MCRHAAFKRALQELITVNPGSQLFSHPRVQLHRGGFHHWDELHKSHSLMILPLLADEIALPL